MKTSFSLKCGVVAVAFLSFSSASQAQLLKRLKETVKQHAEDRADSKVGNATDKAMDKTEEAAKGNKNSSSDAASSNDGTGTADAASGGTTAAPAAAPSLKTYQNYDFVPGDTVLFSDDFTGDQDGEFPSHWNLNTGQAVLNKVNGEPAFFLTEGNYCRVYPLMKTQSYLTDPFTIEFDYYPTDGAYGVVLFLKYTDTDGNDADGQVYFNERGGVETSYFSKGFSADYPNEDDATYWNHWHHCALIYKNNQLKCYIDQNRILVAPNLGAIPYAFGFGGIGSTEHPIIISSVRAAAGGSMNMIGRKFTESKIVTHGITFDVDKSDIKPESMGTLNMIYGVLKSNPDLKFEIDGHTDNTGEASHNLTLSQQRAESVKAELIKMGVDASRLTTQGFGDTKPIGPNDTPEGKANNRRVEFVRK
jgi:outer membrane protein OmpA-like peptidoglycan-associated protein